MEFFEIDLSDAFSAGPISTTVRLLLHAQKTGDATLTTRQKNLKEADKKLKEGEKKTKK